MFKKIYTETYDVAILNCIIIRIVQTNKNILVLAEFKKFQNFSLQFCLLLKYVSYVIG
jgi:hypothetical protein